MPAVAPLRRDERLEVAAQRHALDMASNLRRVTHEGSDASSPQGRAHAAGYPAFVGENAGARADIPAMIANWMESPGHCRGLMNPLYEDMGAACAKNKNSDPYGYWSFLGGYGEVKGENCGIENFANSMLEAINQTRAQPQICGEKSMSAVSPVRWNAILEAGAKEHAADMASRDKLSFYENDTEYFSRLERLGYPGDLRESVSQGARQVPDAVRSFLNYPSNCENIMNPAHREMGAACANRNGDPLHNYWSFMGGSGGW